MPADFDAKRVLLLQGPVGPFFRRLCRELQSHDVEVTKVNFNGGDALFFGGPFVVPFRGAMSEWPEFFRSLAAKRNIEAVFLFGDCRPIHREASRICSELGIAVWVFEEGYVRPDHVTLERGGVNGYSSMSKDPDFYRRATRDLPELQPPVRIGRIAFWYSAWFAILYWSALTLSKWRYPRYRHHRNANAFREAFCWGRGGIRKLRYRLRERRVIGRVENEWSGDYFLVPLQVYCDAQLQHSDFDSMEAFIDEVVRTFAECAPAGTRLILKHHPADRPYRDYTRYVRQLGERYGCSERIVYVHDLHLPTLLENARGTVTMNSTAGSASLQHSTPLKVLGQAVYDIPQLTCERDLGSFFQDPGEVDRELYSSFRRWLMEVNQVNGNFYKRAPGLPSPTGMRLDRLLWPAQGEVEPVAAAAADQPVIKTGTA